MEICNLIKPETINNMIDARKKIKIAEMLLPMIIEEAQLSSELGDQLLKELNACKNKSKKVEEDLNITIIRTSANGGKIKINFKDTAEFELNVDGVPFVFTYILAEKKKSDMSTSMPDAERGWMYADEIGNKGVKYICGTKSYKWDEDTTCRKNTSKTNKEILATLQTAIDKYPQKKHLLAPQEFVINKAKRFRLEISLIDVIDLYTLNQARPI